MAQEAELVSSRNRRPHDPSASPEMMAQRAGASIVESKGSHAVYVSRPEAVASIIKSATRG
jgi:hypothetical protein